MEMEGSALCEKKKRKEKWSPSVRVNLGLSFIFYVGRQLGSEEAHYAKLSLMGLSDFRRLV